MLLLLLMELHKQYFYIRQTQLQDREREKENDPTERNLKKETSKEKNNTASFQSKVNRNTDIELLPNLLMVFLATQGGSPPFTSRLQDVSSLIL